MIRAFWKLQEVHTGLNSQNLITMRIALPRSTYAKNEQADGFWLRLDERIHQIPGVESAALVSGLAPQRPPNMNDTDIEGFVAKPEWPDPECGLLPDGVKRLFFHMGIRLIAGRLFDDRDVTALPMSSS